MTPYGAGLDARRRERDLLLQSSSTFSVCNRLRGTAINVKMMNPRTDKLVRRTTMVATATASYFLLTADYGPEPNVLDPIKNAILSAQNRAKEFVLGPSDNKPRENQMGSMGANNPKEQP